MVHSKLWFSISTYNLKTVPGVLTFHNSRSQNSNIEFTILLLYNRGTKWIRFSRLKILELNKKYPHLSRKRSILLYIGVPPLPQEWLQEKQSFFQTFHQSQKILRHRTMTAQQSTLIASLIWVGYETQRGDFWTKKTFQIEFQSG